MSTAEQALPCSGATTESKIHIPVVSLSDPVGLYYAGQDWDDKPHCFVERTEARQMKKRGEGGFINSGRGFQLNAKQPPDMSKAHDASPEAGKPFAGSSHKTAITSTEMQITAGLLGNLSDRLRVRR